MTSQNQQTSSFWYDGIAIVRIMTGLLLIVHGWQVFESGDQRALTDVLFNMSMPFPEAMAYSGMILEVIGGLFLILGLFTRFMALLLFVIFMLLTFVIGEGRVLAENQSSFLYALIALLFLFTGAGRFSTDYILFLNRADDHQKEQGMEVSKRFGRYVSKS